MVHERCDHNTRNDPFVHHISPRLDDVKVNLCRLRRQVSIGCRIEQQLLVTNRSDRDLPRLEVDDVQLVLHVQHQVRCRPWFRRQPVSHHRFLDHHVETPTLTQLGDIRDGLRNFFQVTSTELHDLCEHLMDVSTSVRSIVLVRIHHRWSPSFDRQFQIGTGMARHLPADTAGTDRLRHCSSFQRKRRGRQSPACPVPWTSR